MINRTIDIWEGLSYEASQNTGFRPKMETYILDGDKKRPAILIFPGGGYECIAHREGEPIALNYNAAGLSSFVLHYSIFPSKYPQCLLDAARAISIIKENADAWNIDKDKVAVCGFSAGGHLAALLGVYWDRKDLFKVSGIREELTKPNALILSYPVITSGEFAHRPSFVNLLKENEYEKLLDEVSVEKHVSEKTPKTFIWHTFADGAVPVENSMMFVKELRKYKVPFEFHIYPEGGHGLSLATEELNEDGTQLNPHVASWFNLSIEWLKSIFE